MKFDAFNPQNPFNYLKNIPKNHHNMNFHWLFPQLFLSHFSPTTHSIFSVYVSLAFMPCGEGVRGREKIAHGDAVAREKSCQTCNLLTSSSIKKVLFSEHWNSEVIGLKIHNCRLVAFNCENLVKFQALKVVEGICELSDNLKVIKLSGVTAVKGL